MLDTLKDAMRWYLAEMYDGPEHKFPEWFDEAEIIVRKKSNARYADLDDLLK